MIAANSKIAVYWNVTPYQCAGSIPMFRRILLEAVGHSERRDISTRLHGVALEGEFLYRCENLKCV